MNMEKTKKKSRQCRLSPQPRNLWQKFKKDYLSHWQLWLMVVPAVVFMYYFAYRSMYGIQIAFRDFSMRKGITGSDWVGFDNFERLFDNYWFPIILKNTLTLSLLGLVLGFPLPILFALAANEVRNERVKRTLQTVSYAPYFISTIVLCGMVTLFLSPSTGIVNSFLKLFGMEPIAFMQTPGAFKWIYVLSGVWQGTGWGAIVYFAALSNVDKSLLEAASIDGASRFQKVIYINFPVLVPTMVILFILNCGSMLSVGYEKVYALQNSVNLAESEVISTYVYKMGLQSNDFSFSTAAGLFNSVVNTIILIASNKISKMVTENSLW